MARNVHTAIRSIPSNEVMMKPNLPGKNTRVKIASLGEYARDEDEAHGIRIEP